MKPSAAINWLDAPEKRPDAESMTALFLTLEGIDGAGKTTHLQHLAEHLRQQGRTVVLTREPGGTELAERLRDAVLHQAMDGLTEALLVFAARRDHLQRVIRPALTRGDTVLCDRFTDATFAYQGGGRGMSLEVLGQLEAWVQEGLQPDLTWWFDLPAQEAARRRAAARAADRFEAQDVDFFTQVRQAYLTRAQEAPHRIVPIDATADVAGVWAQLLKSLDQRGW